MFGFSPFSSSAFADLLETNDVSVTLTGAVASVQLGTAGTSGNAVIIETGEQAVALLGTPAVRADTNVSAIGVFAAGAVGTLTVTGTANLTLTGVSASAELGTAVARADTNAIVGGVAAQGALGTVTTSGIANVTLTGVEASALVDSVTVRLVTRLLVTGVSALGGVTTPAVAGSSNVTVLGVQATGRVTTPLIWSPVNDNQIPDWTQIRDGNRYEGSIGAAFGFGSFSEVSFSSLGFDGIPEEPWREVNDGNTVVWTQIPT